MENIDFSSSKNDKDFAMDMSVSPICEKEGQKYAFVTFSDGKRIAEGRIPECKLISGEGFSEEEKQALEDYMRSQLTTLKKMAAGVNVFSAFLKN